MHACIVYFGKYLTELFYFLGTSNGQHPRPLECFSAHCNHTQTQAFFGLVLLTSSNAHCTGSAARPVCSAEKVHPPE